MREFSVIMVIFVFVGISMSFSQMSQLSMVLEMVILYFSGYFAFVTKTASDTRLRQEQLHLVGYRYSHHKKVSASTLFKSNCV
jgi:hypothetical protein